MTQQTAVPRYIISECHIILSHILQQHREYEEFFQQKTAEQNASIKKSLTKSKYQDRSQTYLAPIESIVQMKGLSSSPNPAITGWQKYGTNLV